MIHSAGQDFMKVIVGAMDSMGLEINSYSTDTFTERFTSECAGVVLTVSFDLPYSECGDYEVVVPSGVIGITENGTYDVSRYETAIVDVNFEPEDLYATELKLNFKDNLTLTEFDSRKMGLEYIKWTNLSRLFEGCKNLESVNLTGFDTSYVTGAGYMFASCGKLDVIDFETIGYDFHNCTSIDKMFGDLGHRDATKPFILKNFEKVRFGTITSISNFLQNAFNCDIDVLDLTNLDVSGCKQISYLFFQCNGIKKIDLRGWDMSHVTSTEWRWFEGGNSQLEEIDMTGAKFPDVTNIGLNFSQCNKLSVDSIVTMLEALPISTKGGKFQLSNSRLLNGLTDVQKAIATSKGWVLS